MKIGVIFTGGTIGSRKGEGGIAPTDAAPRHLLSAYAARTGDSYEFPTAEPYTILSENLTWAHIGVLEHCVREKAAEWDGIIITHGTDTLQYTGTALGYILGLSSKPVVLVSANYPLNDERSNGLDNFCAAVAFLRTVQGATGVFTAYRNRGEDTRIHRSVRLLAHQTLDDVIYSLDDSGTVATVAADGTVTLNKSYVEKPDGQPPLSGENLSATEGRILPLVAYPGMRYPALDGVAAVLLETYHSGTVATGSTALRIFAKKAGEQGVPIFLAGVPAGGTAYASGRLYDELGLLTAPPISPIAAYLKLCLAFANGRDPMLTLNLPLGGDQ